MKGIICDLGEINIPLKRDEKPIKKWSYRLNTRYKEKVKEELDRMLNTRIIEPVKELEWIIPMVFQDNKTGEVHICVDLWKLIDVFLHDPFPTPFTNEFLESIGGK